MSSPEPIWSVTNSLSVALDESERETVLTLHSTPDGDIIESDWAAAMDTLIDQWIYVAMGHVRVRRVDYEWFADIAGIDGAWGVGNKRNEAYADLETTLREWVDLKLADNDRDIPAMEGVKLVLDD